MVGVDWRLLADAMSFFKGEGYEEVDLPWLAPLDVLAVTCPDRLRVLDVPGLWGQGLVGSAEQSFIAADLDGTLGKGRFVACTPCFRNEPTVSETHRIGFMKVELYANLDQPHLEAGRMLGLARRFMESECGRTVLVEETGDGHDLTLGGIEVGSFGFRRARGIEWAYGTGIAEPRFSVARRAASR
jgi:hypothetical protein